jgi:hypothetical protein
MTMTIAAIGWERRCAIERCATRHGELTVRHMSRIV